MRTRVVGLAAVAAWALACGGGGGGPGGSGDGPAVVSHTREFGWTYRRGDPLLSNGILDLVVRGVPASSISTRVELSGLVGEGFSAPPVLDEADAAHLSFEVYPRHPEEVVPGLYRGELTTHVCTDEFCTGPELAGSPFTIPMTYELPGFETSYQDVKLCAGCDPADARHSFVVGEYPSQGFTIRPLQPWLEVTPTSGRGGPVVVTISLREDQLAGVEPSYYDLVELRQADTGKTITVSGWLYAPASRPANLVRNGSFTEGMTGWRLVSWMEGIAPEASAQIVDGGVRVTPVPGEADEFDPALVSDRFAAVPGRWYWVRFTARSDTSRIIQVMADDSLQSYRFLVGPDEGRFSLQFQADSSTPRIRVIPGGSTGFLELDDVSVSEDLD